MAAAHRPGAAVPRESHPFRNARLQPADGSRWPASREDLLLAKALLHDLELGPLLERMPNGIHQVVGETGWQLSHGERSRIFLARAILQSADLLILDESFAALDPETLESCLRVLFAQQRTILVIAHP